MKPLTRCRYDRGLCSVNPKLQRHPNQVIQFKENSPIKIAWLISRRKIYNLKQKPRSQRYLGKVNFLNSIFKHWRYGNCHTMGLIHQNFNSWVNL